MVKPSSQCVLQVFSKEPLVQVFTTIELAAKTIFYAENSNYDIPRYVIFIGGKSVRIVMTFEGLPKIKIAIKDEESLIEAVMKEMNK